PLCPLPPPPARAESPAQAPPLHPKPSAHNTRSYAAAARSSPQNPNHHPHPDTDRRSDSRSRAIPSHPDTPRKSSAPVQASARKPAAGSPRCAAKGPREYQSGPPGSAPPPAHHSTPAYRAIGHTTPESPRSPHQASSHWNTQKSQTAHGRALETEAA